MRITIAEAAVLSVVAIIAAWSGYSAAKWGTHSSLELAKASATRAKANRAYEEALTLRVGDSTTFNAWFGAYISGRRHATAVAERRFRPEYRVAFDAWLATHPFTNPKAPPGPGYMPQYHPAGQAASVRLDAEAEARYKDGEHAAGVSDDYVRTTVILASVLFLIGISSHFPVRSARIGLISVGVGLLIFAIVLIALLPPPTRA
ncbi:MAG TPA: hypothetical protein VMT74_07575 [Gaiellaceae bacterium]|nr:hypothetical protein [Gaiellaceae bacterium]